MLRYDMSYTLFLIHNCKIRGHAAIYSVHAFEQFYMQIVKCPGAGRGFLKGGARF